MQVDVWVGRLSAQAEAAQAAGLDWLAEDEQSRLVGMKGPRRRAQFLAGHWLARQRLAAVHGGDARRDWVLTAAVDGPPRVVCREPAHRRGGQLKVALSHSGEWIACAVSTGAIGLDIEVPLPRRDPEDRRVFPPRLEGRRMSNGRRATDPAD